MRERCPRPASPQAASPKTGQPLTRQAVFGRHRTATGRAAGTEPAARQPLARAHELDGRAERHVDRPGRRRHDDAHLYEFGAQWERYGHNGREPSAYTVAQVLPEVGSGAGYVYDFGDYWTHHITVEKIHRPAANTHYPRFSAGRRACPPEDCGGPLGYERTLRAIRARKGPRYRELREWGLHKYNLAHFDRDEINRGLADPKSVGYPEPAPWQREVLDLSGAGTRVHPLRPVHPLTTVRHYEGEKAVVDVWYSAVFGLTGEGVEEIPPSTPPSHSSNTVSMAAHDANATVLFMTLPSGFPFQPIRWPNTDS
ncbi:plasmid pRiA4b ORF-3 family protein [Streptomyces sp. NPDC050388]|uniref:plasmid pRiA4b ORF-3 family protein n=1 Tax=Streptomyces sp. NPDC050388 TaxID=3155781 RepID=UPI00342E088B